MRNAILAAPALLALTACQQSLAEAPPPAPPAEDACGAAKLAHYVGKEATPGVEAELAADSTAEATRTIRPGDAVTMDFRPDRLNIEIGKDGKIKRIYCS